MLTILVVVVCKSSGIKDVCSEATGSLLNKVIKYTEQTNLVHASTSILHTPYPSIPTGMVSTKSPLLQICSMKLFKVWLDGLKKLLIESPPVSIQMLANVRVGNDTFSSWGDLH